MAKCYAVTVDPQVQPRLTPLVNFVRLTRFQGLNISIQGPQMPTATEKRAARPFVRVISQQGFRWQEVPFGKLAGRV